MSRLELSNSARASRLALRGVILCLAGCHSPNGVSDLGGLRVVSTQSEVKAEKVGGDLYFTRFNLLLERRSPDPVVPRKVCVRTVERGPERVIEGPTIELLDKKGRTIPEEEQFIPPDVRYVYVPMRNFAVVKEYNYVFAYDGTPPEDVRFYRTLWSVNDCRTRRTKPFASDWMPITIRSE